ncbi:EsaB/YukD family protein [Enterococcus hirae]|nr:EsaB/YukD family protein [Enterococcus hirae]
MKQGIVIDICLQIEQQTIDLQIPREITIRRLKELFVNALQVSSIVLPAAFDLEVTNKLIRLNEEFLLSDYPISHGDQLLIKPRILNGGDNK